MKRRFYLKKNLSSTFLFYLVKTTVYYRIIFFSYNNLRIIFLNLLLLSKVPSNGPIPSWMFFSFWFVLSPFFLQPLGAVAPPNENLRFLVLFFTVACSSLFYRTRWQIRKNTNDAEPYFSQFSIIIFYFTLIGVCTKVHKVGAWQICHSRRHFHVKNKMTGLLKVKGKFMFNLIQPKKLAALSVHAIMIWPNFDVYA